MPELIDYSPGIAMVIVAAGVMLRDWMRGRGWVK